jgi:hypothetical protein
MYVLTDLISDLFHEKCLLGYCDRAMRDTPDRLEAFKQIRCPICRNSVVPYECQTSALTESVKQAFLASPWRDLIEVLVPSNFGVKKSLSQVDRNSFANDHIMLPNSLQPNTKRSSSHHAIDMANVESWKDWYLRQGESLATGTSKISTGGLKRYILTCPFK